MAVERSWIRRFLIVAAALVVIVLTLPIALTPGLRTRLTAALGERFDSEVELSSLRVSVLPRLRVAGEGLVLRHKGRTDVPPLITIPAFSATANLWGVIGGTVRLSNVNLDGLEINIPPGGLNVDGDDDDDDDDRPEDPKDPENPPAPPDADPPPAGESPIVVHRLLTERAVLRILRRDPKDEPRVFEIAHLAMQNAGSNDTWPFSAELTNPTPPGEIAVEGTFGPWHAERPAYTPLGATYTFTDADLGVFEGIRGILQSTGEFAGVLERIEVQGSADVPEFALEDVGQGVPLKTTFSAIVDGTNGNTWLKPVNAELGKSPILAEGGVVEKEDDQGRTVALDVVMSDARVEDVLRLAVKGAPAMTGGLKLRTKFVLPPGKGKALEKLQLDGSFELVKASFTRGEMQQKMNELSQKAQGDGDSDEPPDRVVSDFSGKFVMKGGTIRFSSLTFSVPGAKLDLAGTYAVRSEALDFRGTVRLDAKLSELTSGFKSFLLKMVDPLVRRKDVTVIPITIRGTAQKPDFGLDIKRAFTPK